jgi:beta-glucosidase
VVGTWSRDQMELWQGLNATTGEHVDLDSLDLVGAMRPLLEAIVDTGTPTVIVFQSGKPITEDWISNTTASLVQQFYPSEQGGHALADILFGDVNPSGKLSVSFPHSVGDLPIYYDFLKSGRTTDPGYVGRDGQLYFGHQYVFGTPQPWFEFGYGLSYTTFDYSDVKLSARTVSSTDTVTATVQITNSGKRDGAEVVQLYVTDMLASVDIPNIQLKGFEKVMIAAGETETVSFDLKVSDCGLWNQKMQYVVEPGEFTVFVGASSLDLRGNASFVVS